MVHVPLSWSLLPFYFSFVCMETLLYFIHPADGALREEVARIRVPRAGLPVLLPHLTRSSWLGGNYAALRKGTIIGVAVDDTSWPDDKYLEGGMARVYIGRAPGLGNRHEVDEILCRSKEGRKGSQSGTRSVTFRSGLWKMGVGTICN